MYTKNQKSTRSLIAVLISFALLYVVISTQYRIAIHERIVKVSNDEISRKALETAIHESNVAVITTAFISLILLGFSYIAFNYKNKRFVQQRGV